jgi:hypothetical protein
MNRELQLPRLNCEDDRPTEDFDKALGGVTELHRIDTRLRRDISEGLYSRVRASELCFYKSDLFLKYIYGLETYLRDCLEEGSRSSHVKNLLRRLSEVCVRELKSAMYVKLCTGGFDRMVE